MLHGNLGRSGVFARKSPSPARALSLLSFRCAIARRASISCVSPPERWSFSQTLDASSYCSVAFRADRARRSLKVVFLNPQRTLVIRNRSSWIVCGPLDLPCFDQQVQLGNHVFGIGTLHQKLVKADQSPFFRACQMPQTPECHLGFVLKLLPEAGSSDESPPPSAASAAFLSHSVFASASLAARSS